MTQVGRTSRRLRSIAAAVAVMVAAAALVPETAQTTMTSSSSSATPSVGDSTPSGAVGGVRSPVEAGSTLSLVIDASEAGGGLASAQASIGGHSASVSLCPAPGPAAGGPGGCPESVSEVPLSLDVGGEGAYELLVSVTDAAGSTATVAERTIEVLAPVPPGSNTLTIGISAGRVGPPGGFPPEEGSPEERARSEILAASTGQLKLAVCPSPMLEMNLASRPVGHTRQGVPVLRRGWRYRFTGRLTCLDGRRRIQAPDGTRVRVRYEHGGCAFGRRVFGRRVCMPSSRWHTATVHRGRLSVRLPIVGRGTIVFSYRPSDGESVQVSLPVAVPHGRRHRSGRRR